MIRAGVVGASGYTGIECCRLLDGHPLVQLTHIYSSQSVGISFKTLYPQCVTALGDLVFSAFNPESLDDLDVLFLALPHGQTHGYDSLFTQTNVKIIDLSADYRLKDETIYESFYDVVHKNPHRLKNTVYGLPELYRNEIKNASYVANPGCYTTASILALHPLTSAGVLEGGIVIDAKSGASGAGKSLKSTSLFCEVNESFSAYGTGVHRHTAEIEQELGVSVFFSPHLLPMNRGILATCYVTLKESVSFDTVLSLYSCYDNEPFTHVNNSIKTPSTAYVVDSNNCIITLKYFPKYRRLVIFSVIDNVLKGASGQAIQNMNVMFNFEEHLGLPRLSTYF